jgi:transcription antitermination factor NusG
MLGNEVIDGLAARSYSPEWYALYTRYQHEKTVAHTLVSKGFEVFLPQYRAVHRWKDREKKLLLPLFPNYVFIHGGLDRMLNIVTTPGVHSLISWGSKPAVIPAEEIEVVRRLVEGPFAVEPHPYLQCGDVVRIKSGPLEGIQGILVRKTRQLRLVLSVDMLCQSASVEVDADMVEQVSPTEVEDRQNDTTDAGAYCPQPEQLDEVLAG